MSNKFEDYIKENRKDFDSIEPSGKLWQNINTSIVQPGFIAGKLSWLKYFLFGSLAITAIVYFSLSKDDSKTSAVLENNFKEETVLPKSPEIEETIAKNEVIGKSVNYSLPEKNILPFTPSLIPTEESTEQINEENNFPLLLNTDIYNPNPVTKVTPMPAFSGEYVPDKNIWLEKDKKLKVDTVFSGIKSIEVNTGAFAVNITSNANDNVFFKADLTIISKGLIIGKGKYRITYEVKDSILSIKVQNSSKEAFFVGHYEERGTLDFDLPKTTNVVVNNSYGDVHAEGLEGKRCEINAEAGNIKVENISTNINIKSGYGDVTATRIIGHLNAKISSGDLKVNDLSGDMDIKASYGDQTYKNINGNINLANASGDVKITDMKGDMEISSSYGNISLENFTGSAIIKSASGDIKGKNVMLTDSLTITSSYGDIKMDLANDPADLSFDLKTNYGKIGCSMYEKKLEAERQLIINKGKIRVKGVSNSGDQSYE